MKEHAGEIAQELKDEPFFMLPDNVQENVSQFYYRKVWNSNGLILVLLLL